MSTGRSDSQDEERSLPESGEPGRGPEGDSETPEAPSGKEMPDVTLDVPGLNIEELNLRVENLRARISLQSELVDAVKINVGVDAYLDGVELELKGLEAQALLKANLDNVRDILARTLDTLDNNPRLIESLAQAAGESTGVLEGVASTIGDTPQSPEQEGGEDRRPGEESPGGADATQAARRKAEELGVDLNGLEGSGSGGRIIVKDVVKAANRERNR